MLRELRLGALSLEHIVSASPDCPTVGASGDKLLAVSGDAKPSHVGKSTMTARPAKPEMKRSYSHGCQPSSGGWTSKIAWKGLDGSVGCSSVREDIIAENLRLFALEIGEVEPHMFRQLALLCSVRQYAVTRAQIAHPSALRSIFSLLKVGSPRMQR